MTKSHPASEKRNKLYFTYLRELQVTEIVIRTKRQTIRQGRVVHSWVKITQG